MSDMIRHQILPAVSRYASDLSERAWKKEQTGVSAKYERTVAKQIGELTDKLLDAAEKLESDLKAVPSDSVKAMDYTHKTILSDMAAARADADELETLTDRAYWPFPVYSDLLFYVK